MQEISHAISLNAAKSLNKYFIVINFTFADGIIIYYKEKIDADGTESLHVPITIGHYGLIGTVALKTPFMSISN